MVKIRLDSMSIDENSSPYIIAEIGVNHEGSLEKAINLIELAKKGGANAAKFQTYKADSIASVNSPAYWDRSKEKTNSQHELFQKYDNFNEKDYYLLSEHCNKVGIDFVSTPFDTFSVNFLDPMLSYFKIASADITNLPFLRKIASKHKPILLSTGASNMEEIDLAITELQENGSGEICLMHCILNYPTENENANLDMIEGLKKSYPEKVIGYSDHTLPDPQMLVLTAAYLKGAMVIEKHFTNDKTLPGNDHYHAMDVEDLKRFKKNIQMLQSLKGSKIKEPIPSEDISREHARRSIVLSHNVKAGTILSEDDLTCKRPGNGISPLYWDKVIKMKVLRNLEKDYILKWSDFELK
jgi:N-acetylneuraminate synthase|tara:strand:+ start:568 stop:1629 length:1062 start_codon:yes stop_codon:yes gene_type:complete